MHSKVNCKQNEKATLRMGENICKLCEWQGMNLQNIQIAQYQKKPNKPNQKMGRRPK